MKNRKGAAVALALSVVLASVEVRAAFVVVPNSLTSVEGDLQNAAPFDISDPRTTVLPSQRYQQVYAASQFPSLAGQVLITQIAFRPNSTAELGEAFSSTLPDIQIDLSTTTAPPDGLSQTFASNVGGNDRIVYSGALTISSSFTGPANGPKDFDIIIDLRSPFLYDPRMGNLLLDVRNFSAGTTTFFDATYVGGDSVSRAATFSGGTVESATAQFADTLGLVTRFQYAFLPQLSITATNPATVVLSWPVSSDTFVLQQNQDPSSPNWIIVTNAPILASGAYQVSLPALDDRMFYRLFFQSF